MINNGCFGAVAVAAPTQRSDRSTALACSIRQMSSTIMAAAGNNIVRFTYTGADGEYIPDGVTHITIVNLVHSYVQIHSVVIVTSLNWSAICMSKRLRGMHSIIALP